MRSAHHECKARSPLRPGSRTRIRALEAQGSRCSLSLILGAFYPTNLFIYFLLLIYFLFVIQHNLSGRKSNSSGRGGRFWKIRFKAGELPPKTGALESLHFFFLNNTSAGRKTNYNGNSIVSFEIVKL